MLVICASTSPNLAEGKKAKEAEKAQPDQHVEDQFGTYNKQFLLRYIDSIGRRLNAQLPTGKYDFRFRIVDQAEPNAFALPSGYIYLSRGLLALINSEDELAAIAAHAMSHITLGHTARQGEQYVSPESMSLPESALRKAIAENLSELITTPVAVPGAAPRSAYDLDDESRADRAGMSLAAEAGYDPAALGVVLDTLSKAAQLFPDFQARSFFDPHPVTLERLAAISEYASKIDWTPGQPFARNKAALLKRLDGLRWGGQVPANGVFQGQNFLHSGLDIGMTFPEGWYLANTPNFVGGFEKDRKALIVFGGVDRPADPKTLGEAFIARIDQEIELSPTENRAVEAGEWPGYLVRFEEDVGVEPLSLYFLWVTSPQMTFQLIGLGTEQYREQLRDAALSLHNLNAEERESIVGYRLAISEAMEGEGLIELSTRTGNALSDELTAVINELPVDAVLEESDLIKIVRRDPQRR